MSDERYQANAENVMVDYLKDIRDQLVKLNKAKEAEIPTECLCSEWTSKTGAWFYAVTFNCPKHGQVTLDFRIPPMPISTNPLQGGNWGGMR